MSTSASNAPGEGRLLQLDALRGIAAMSVVLFHFTSGFSHAIPAHSSPLFVFSSGSVGVQMFFVISGFVIFMTLERTRSFADFARSRFARLYPTYIACVCITLLSIVITGINYRHIGLLTVLSAPIMATGVINGLYVDSSYWTLTLEICFYAWAAVAYFCGREKLLLIFVAAWIPVTALLRALGLPEHYPRLNALLLAEQFQWFAVGICIYCLHERRHVGASWVILALAVVSAAFPALGDAAGIQFHAKELVKVILIALVVYAAARGALRVLALAPLLYLGAISYALFLVHQVVGFNLLIVLDAAGVPVDVGIPVVLALSIAIAAGVRRFIELPAYRAIRPQRQLAMGT